jgi:hypothetical protein
MSFDEEVAERYDERAVHAGGDPGDPPVGDVPATVAFLERLARRGPALELAIAVDEVRLDVARVRVGLGAMTVAR